MYCILIFNCYCRHRFPRKKIHLSFQFHTCMS